MSTDTVSQASPPIKGDIVLTRKGHRRLWDGRHWRVLCRITACKAQRQGSLHNKLGLCKKHFSQMGFANPESTPSAPPKIEQKQTISKDEEQKTTKKLCKRQCRSLDSIVDRLRRSQAASSSYCIEHDK